MNNRTMTFHILYKKYAKDVYRFAYWLSGDEAEAKDITSETFVRVWTAKKEPVAETVKAYLFTITRNLFLKSRHRKKRFFQLSEDLVDKSIQPDTQTEINQHLTQVKRAIQTLSEIEKSVLILKTEEEMSYQEIARATDLTVAAVKVKVFRARARINKILKEEKDK